MDKEHFAKVNIVSHGSLDAMKTEEIALPEVPAEIRAILDEKE